MKNNDIIHRFGHASNMGRVPSKPKLLASVRRPHSAAIEAGKKILVCTVCVSLPKKVELCPRNSDVQVPRPICTVRGDSSDTAEDEEGDLGWVGLNVLEAREERTATSKVFRISLYVMKSGRRFLEISFPSDFDVTIEGSPKVALSVYPSTPYSLHLGEVRDDGGAVTPEASVNSLAFIRVVASDQYGNLCDGTELDLSLFNQGDSFQLVSSAPVLYARGAYELAVRCLDEGDYVVEIGFTGMAKPLMVPLRVRDRNPLRRVWRRSLSDSFYSSY